MWQCADCLNHRYICPLCQKEGYDANYYQKLVDEGQIEEGSDVQMQKIRAKRRKVSTGHTAAIPSIRSS